MTQRFTSNKLTADRLFVGACLLLLALPGICFLGVDLDDRNEELLFRERRGIKSWKAPAAVPDVTGWAEEAYADRLGLRTSLMRLRGWFHWGVLGESPSDETVRGKDDWLFLDYSRHLDNWRGAVPMGEELLADWVTTFQIRQELVATTGADYFVCILPGKPSIYPERIPDRFARIGPSRRDQLMGALREAGVPVRDFLPTMLVAKAGDVALRNDYLVHPTGTHWSGRGERVAEAWLRRQLDLPRFRQDWERRIGSRSIGDTWVTRLYLEAVRPINRREWWTIDEVGKGIKVRGARFSRQWNNGDRKILMNHDSYGRGVRDLLGRNTTLTALWDYAPHLGRIRSSGAEVVIDWFVERMLDDMVPSEIRTYLPGDLALAFAEGEDIDWALGPGQEGNWYRMGVAEEGVPLEEPASFLLGEDPARLVLGKLPSLEQDCVLELDLTAPGGGVVEVGVIPMESIARRNKTAQSAAIEQGRQVIFLPLTRIKLGSGNQLEVFLNCGPGTWTIHGARMRTVVPLNGMGLRRRKASPAHASEDL